MEASTVIALVVGIGSLASAAIGILMFWMRFATSIADAKSAANAANIATATLHMDIDQLKNGLVEHRVAVAKEYVSKGTVESLEVRILGAINQLGERIDHFFKAGTH